MAAVRSGMKVSKACDSMKKLGRIQYARRINENSVGMVTEAPPLLDWKLSVVIPTLLIVVGVYSMKI